MDQVTMVAFLDTVATIKSLQIGQDAIPIDGRTIKQCLESMQVAGWRATKSCLRSTDKGMICQFEFER